MPTALHRIQVLMEPDLAAKVKTIAKMERRSHSAMVAEMVETAMKMPKYRDILQEAEETGATIPTKEDPRGKVYQAQTRVEDETFSQAQLEQLAALLGAKSEVIMKKASKPDSQLTDRIKEVTNKQSNKSAAK